MTRDVCTVKIPGCCVSGKNVGEMLTKFDTLLQEKYGDDVVSTLRRNRHRRVRRAASPRLDIDHDVKRLIRRRR